MDAYLNELVRYLVTQSWQIAVLAVVVAAATWALRHKTAHIRYLLWLIVLAKCLVPPLYMVPVRILPETVPDRVPPVLSGAILTDEHFTLPGPAARTRREPRESVLAQSTSEISEPHLSVSGWLGVLWIAGAGGYLLMNLLRALRGRLWLRRTRRPLCDDVQTEMANLLPAYGIEHLPRIWIADGVGQPFVWGLLRGSIYVPPGFFAVGSPQHRRNVLAHELSHVLRFDPAVNTLQVIIQGLFWFHPLVWWANRRIRQEREKACDEVAVARLGAKPKDYSTALVSTLIQAQESTRPVPSLAVAGPARNLEERIRSMLRPGRQFYRRPTAPTALVILLMAMVTVPTAVVLTVRARAEVQTAEDQAALSKITVAYEASRDAAPTKYLLVAKNDLYVYVTYRDGARLHKAAYAIGSPRFGEPLDMEAIARDRRVVGDTLDSILAWTAEHLAQNAEVYDGTYACTIWADGHNHFEGGRKTTRRPDEVSGIASLPTLRGIGWPAFGLGGSSIRLISTDRFALDHDLVCIEEQKQAIRDGREKITLTTRFYLNPERNFICERKHEASYDYAEQVTKYGKIRDAQWYPVEISEFGYKHQGRPMTGEPSQINRIYLDADPTFPADIFSPDALIARYGDLLVSPEPGIPSSTEPEDDSSVRVAGRVLDGATREPIVGALVRVAAPAIDMRHARVAVEQTLYETRTGGDGLFELLVPITEEMNDTSVDAMAPGYNTAAGTFRNGADDPLLGNLPLDRSWRNLRSSLTILLSPGLYVAGTVRDDQGRPVPGMTVFATLRTERSSGGIARTQTDAQGRFEIFDYPLQKQPDEWAVLSFTSATTRQENVTGLYDMTDEQRRSLEVTVHSGREITGVVHNAASHPAAGITVEAVAGWSIVIRETTTDRDGHFELAGLPAGPLDVRAYDLANDQKAMLPITAGNVDREVTVRMQPIKLTDPVEPVTMLGMQVVDATQELQEAYDADDSEGVMIWDPGPDSGRLGIGELKKGYCIWMVGDKRITNLKEMVAEILQAQLTPWQDGEARFRDPPARVRVVYSTRGSNNTQNLKLTTPDVAELGQLADRLGIAVMGDNP